MSARQFGFAILILGGALTACAAEEPSQGSRYVLGSGDQIVLRVPDVEEISDKPIRIGPDGQIHLPLVGRLTVAGKSIDQLEADLAQRLKVYLRDPRVSVAVTEFRSQPVSVLGSVKNPGVVQLEGRKTLAEVLSLAGGPLEDAGYTVRISRRKEFGPIDLPGAQEDPSGRFTTAEVRLKSVLENRNPAENIAMRPFDVVSVPRANVIYVIGQVHKSGGFTVREREHISVLQALALAEWFDRTAATKRAKILRTVAGEPQRQEIPLNLSRVLEGKEPDPLLQPDDILFVPSNAARSAALRTVEAAIQLGTGVVVFRR